MARSMAFDHTCLSSLTIYISYILGIEMEASVTNTLHFLSAEIDKSINIIKKKSKKNKTKTALINGLTIFLGALITLILGFDISEETVQTQKNLALIAGALLTIVNGWGALFDYKKLWIRQKTTLLSLYQLKNELNFRKSENNEANVDDLFNEYQKIWEVDQKTWTSIVYATSKSSDKKIK